MKNLTAICFALVGLLVVSNVRCFAADKAYTEGSAWEVTFVKTVYAKTDDYLKSLAGFYTKTMDEAKKQDLILSYKVLLGTPATKDDWDIMLMVEYKNMAALDGLTEKFDAISEKAMGGEEKEKKVMEDRGKIREILGTKLVREISLKK